MAELIRTETRHQVATIWINRPDKLNALNAAVLAELAAAFDTHAKNPDIRAIVITGEGRAFVAGADIGEIAALEPADLHALAERGQRIFDAIENASKPVIAAVNGFAFGGGCELALACHVRVASTAAKFGLPEVKLGVIPGYGGTQRLPRLVGRGAALRLILSGEAIDGAEAHRIGLAEFLAEPDKVLETAYAFAGACAKNGPLAIAKALHAVAAGLNGSLPDGLRGEAMDFGALGKTADMREGTKAFLEKRAATFTGE
jgi:enoyl-CoA hydratase